MGSEQQAVNARVRVERLNYGMTFARISLAVKPHICYGWHVLLEQISFDDVEHLLHLTENENAMLRKRSAGVRNCINQLALAGVIDTGGTPTDAAVSQELTARKK